MRLQRDSLPARTSGPLVVYLNHPSWWDPIACSVLIAKCFAEREHWGLIEAAELRRYRFFARLGFLGIDTQDRRNVYQLKAIVRALREQPLATLWLTPEGEFTDPRRRPLSLRPGIGLLARWMPEATFVPLAIEYPFWQERCPELLMRFGQPWCPANEPLRSASHYTDEFRRRLTTEVDALQQLAVSRDDEAFDTLVNGRNGINLPYDLWRRFQAYLSGRNVALEHGSRSDP